MISRTWHGWTTNENAAEYERLLKEEVFPGIAAKNVAGYRGVHLFRRDAGDEVEFMTVMWFDSMEAVREFAGDDPEEAYVPAKPRKVLTHFDARSKHYEVRQSVWI